MKSKAIVNLVFLVGWSVALPIAVYNQIVPLIVVASIMICINAVSVFCGLLGLQEDE
jgi:hypothetical protein